MITFDIIRGHKLILWANRLNFVPGFVEMIDKRGTNYVQEVERMGDGYSVILLVKIRKSKTPMPIIFTCNETQKDSLIETIQVTPLNVEAYDD